MMDIVLGGAMGLVLAVVLSNPPKQAPQVTATVVEPTPDAKADKATNKKRK